MSLFFSESVPDSSFHSEEKPKTLWHPPPAPTGTLVLNSALTSYHSCPLPSLSFTLVSSTVRQALPNSRSWYIFTFKLGLKTYNPLIAAHWRHSSAVNWKPEVLLMLSYSAFRSAIGAMVTIQDGQCTYLPGRWGGRWTLHWEIGFLDQNEGAEGGRGGG